MNGWKNFKCKNSSCGAVLREPREPPPEPERRRHQTHVACCGGCGESLEDRPILSLSSSELEAALAGAPASVRDFVSGAKDRMAVNICECAVSFFPLDGGDHRPIYGRYRGRWSVRYFCDCHASALIST